MNDKIEGVPDGWRLVRIGKVNVGEWTINTIGEPSQINHYLVSEYRNFCVIEKIEQPKQYRQFANAAEFEPHRDRWWRYIDDHPSLRNPPGTYSDFGHLGYDWEHGLERKVFDDGSPFGVEVTG